jgi:phosphatidylglycerol:prolipoprotein diacylglycerol transferase
MKPILLHFSLPFLGSISLPAYFTLLAIGFGMAMLLTVRESRHINVDPDDALDINIYMIIFGILGARVLHVLADGHFMEYVNLCVDPKQVPALDALVKTCQTASECGYDYLCDPQRHVCHPPRDCLRWAKLWYGGFAYYGGFIAASLYCVYYCRRHKIPVMRIGDLAAPGIMLGLFFGRLGCYLNGCCWGKVTESAIGIRFPIGSGPWHAQFEAKLINVNQRMLAVHPAQLYESLGCLLLFALLYYVVRPRKRHDGQVYGAMLILYGVLRSVCEIFRDDDRGVFFGLVSTSQLLSLPLLAIGLYLVLRRRPPVVTSSP